MSLHHLPEPTQCLLWTEPERLRELRFETVTVFDEDDHARRTLVKCPECGQLYFHEMMEETDSEHGRDPIYRSFIPVPTGEHAAALSLASHLSLLRVRPALHYDWPKGQKEPSIAWWRVQPEA